VLRGGGTLRGALVLLREHRRPAFSDQEATAAAAIAQPLTRAVKRVSVRPHGLPCPPLPPGVAVVGPDGAAEAISPQAAAWFSDLHIIGGLTTEDPLPRTVLVAAAAARTAGGAQADQLARIRTKSGRWLSLAACPLRARANPRQLDVLHLLLQGHRVRQIARRLGLSPRTVEDYLKALYRKTGTNSHQELIATLR
jgi:DNA-binding CsgD family transcriptional regulator